MAFLDALRRAVRAQLQQGREVVVAGDFNLVRRDADCFWKDRLLELRRLFRDEPRGGGDGDEGDESQGSAGEGYALPAELQQRCVRQPLWGCRSAPSGHLRMRPRAACLCPQLCH